MRVPHRLRHPGRRGLIVIVALLLAVAGTGAWLILRPGTSQAQAQPITYTVSKTTVKQTVSGSGTLAAAKEADLDFAVSGTVTKVYVKVGETVRKGQALARVGSGTLRASYYAAKAALSSAEQAYDDDVDNGAGSTQLASDSAQIASARASLDQAEKDLADATLRAPFSGTVAVRNLDAGDSVSGGSSGSAGSSSSSSLSSTPAVGSSSGSSSSSSASSAFVVIKPGHFTVTASVSASDVSAVKKGMQVTLTTSDSSSGGSGGFPGFGGGDVPGFGGRGAGGTSSSSSSQDSTTIYGTVTSVGMVADSSSSSTSFPVTIAVTGVHKKLYVGTSVTASITTKQVADALVVPAMALSSSGGKTYVEKIVDGKAVKTAVSIGKTYASQTVITKGLSAGDKIQLATGFTRGSRGGSGGGGGLPSFSGGSGGGLPSFSGGGFGGDR